MSDELNLVPLKKALATLREALELPEDKITRDATIQRFEYSYELNWKTLKRFVS